MRFALPWRFYQQDFLGTDRFLGSSPPPSETADWLVRHPSAGLPDAYLSAIADDLRTNEAPGLSLASCLSITDAGLDALTSLPKLQILDCFNTPIGDAGLNRIAKLTALRSLNLAGTQITDQGLSSLRPLTQLASLHLGWTQITNRGLGPLVELPALKVLELRGCAITDDGLKALAGSKFQYLGVAETPITDGGVAHLPHLKTLQRLDLSYTRITAACVPSLCELSALQSLTLRGTQLPRDLDDELQAAVPGLKCTH